MGYVSDTIYPQMSELTANVSEVYDPMARACMEAARVSGAERQVKVHIMRMPGGVFKLYKGDPHLSPGRRKLTYVNGECVD